jgi:hypothetical protein
LRLAFGAGDGIAFRFYGDSEFRLIFALIFQIEVETAHIAFSLVRFDERRALRAFFTFYRFRYHDSNPFM